MDRARLREYLARALRVALVVIGISPFLPLVFRGVPVLDAIGRGFDGWFAFQCHRDPARTLSIGSRLMPVCSRCFGIYFGLGIGALFMRPKLGVWPLRIWVGAAALVMLLDVVTEMLMMRPALMLVRALTGTLLALPVGSALVRAVRGEDDDAEQHQAEAVRRD
jgi:uncharacterized membrane protein